MKNKTKAMKPKTKKGDLKMTGTTGSKKTTGTTECTGITLDEFFQLKSEGHDVSHIKAGDIVTESGIPVSSDALRPIPKHCHGIRRS